MSKAVLVINMPSSCMECPLGKNMSIAIETCIQCPIGKCAIDAETEKRPDWCPLKPMPSKKMKEIVQEDYDGGYSHGFTHGYNACIDELLKGEEG